MLHLCYSSFRSALCPEGEEGWARGATQGGGGEGRVASVSSPLTW